MGLFCLFVFVLNFTVLFRLCLRDSDSSALWIRFFLLGPAYELGDWLSVDFNCASFLLLFPSSSVVETSDLTLSM